MIGKVKQYLGIEGIKINLEIPEPITKDSGIIEGYIVLSSKNTQTARSFEVRLKEKYFRGRRKSKLINEYVVGRIKLKKQVIVAANTVEKIPFKLPFHIEQSRMDQYEGMNLAMKGLVRLAKFAKAVKSEYRIEAEADVIGTALDPSFTKLLTLK